MRTRCEKGNIVSSLSEQFTKANCFYVVNMFKIDVANMMNFRRICRKNNVSLKIAKSALINIALQGSKINKDVVDEIGKISSKQMCGILFVEEKYNIPAKLIKKFKKELTGGIISLKYAYVDGDLFIGEDKLEILHNLKSKNELIADVILSLLGGINNVILSLNSGTIKLMELLQHLKKK